MATREENLKKINEELEKMSDEELEKVSGGDMWDALKMYLKAMSSIRISSTDRKPPMTMQGG